MFIVFEVWQGLSPAKNCRQLGNDESGRNSLPSGSTHQLAIQHRTDSPKNIHTSNIIQAEQIDEYAYSYPYMHVKSNNKIN